MNISAQYEKLKNKNSRYILQSKTLNLPYPIGEFYPTIV